MSPNLRVLSIQSHVVFGYVGNKSATLPLQLLGFDVDPINSVQLSNHTGYNLTKGQILTDSDLKDLIEGLVENGLEDGYSHLLTGYIGSASFLNKIATLITHLKRINPNLIYVCDPVLGDNGEMYVPQELLPIYKDIIVPLANIITPNQYEAELLTGIKILTLDDAWAAIEVLHEKGCNIVVLSSSDLGDGGTLLALASDKTDNKNVKVKINIPKIQLCFTGSGDLFTALFLAWNTKTNGDIKEALEKTINTVQAVLNRTFEYTETFGVSPKNLELKLVQSKSDIENPKHIISAVVV